MIRSRRKRRSCGVCLLAALGFALFTNAPQRAHADSFAVDPLADGIVLGSGLVLAGFSEAFFHRPAPADLGIADINTVNGFDRLAVFSYSHGLDVASDITLYTTLAVPAVMAAFAGTDGAVSMLIPYLECLAYADFTKNLLKYLLPRQRPWLYMASASGSTPDKWEANDSFPSGHTTLSFAAAVFGLFAFAEYFPNSSYLALFAVGDLGLATVTSSLRVVSGMHFLTDVIAGAALGAAFGSLLPLIHTSPQWRSLTGKSLAAAGMQIQLLRIDL
jgi:undecaprenyl-diphosphatase